MATTLTEFTPQWAFLISEASNTRSREQIFLAAGNNLKSGTVLGQITASGKYTALAPASTDGSQAAAAILCWNTDATAADKRTVCISNEAEVDDQLLVWPSGITTPQKATATSQLLTLQIKLRQGEPQ